MAPPTNKLRLRDLDPSTVALSTAHTMLDHIGSLLIGTLSPAYTMLHTSKARASEDLLPETQLYQSVRTLAFYAVHGGELDAPVQEYLISLIPLFSAALGGGTPDVDGLMRDADPETELGLVIAGAVAREELETGLRGLTTVELAVLSGLSRRQVQQLIAAGELAADEGEVDVVEARRWLAARGVPGIAKTKVRRKR